MKMYEKDVLEKWVRQIQKGQIKPEALGLDSDKDKAIEKLRFEINKLTYKKPIFTIKTQK